VALRITFISQAGANLAGDQHPSNLYRNLGEKGCLFVRLVKLRMMMEEDGHRLKWVDCSKRGCAIFPIDQPSHYLSAFRSSRIPQLNVLVDLLTKLDFVDAWQEFVLSAVYASLLGAYDKALFAFFEIFVLNLISARSNHKLLRLKSRWRAILYAKWLKSSRSNIIRSPVLW